MRRKAINHQRWPAFLALILLGIFLAGNVKAIEVDLVISEIMYDIDGADSGHEWIELYNSGAEELIVSSTWKFFDSANHNINLYQGTSTIANQEFFVLVDNGDNFLLDYPDYVGSIFDTVMSLPNSSSSVALSFDDGETYNLEENYDSLWGANGNGYSLEKADLLASSTPTWQESADLGGTPGQVNSEGQIDNPPEDEDPPVEDPDQGGGEEEELEQAWSQLIINEFLPNPEGSDSGEWIELYNNGPEILNLEGLKIKDNATRIFTLDQDSNLNLNLLANNYLLLPKSVTGISLNNSNGDAVIIMDPEENIIHSVEYNDSALEGRSYAKSDNGFVWTKTPTPGAFNQIAINQAPIAQISVEESEFLIGVKLNFSAKNSYDPEGDDLDYLWEFGDDKTSTKENIKHAFDNLGNYTVRLTVSDPEGAFDIVEFSIEIFQTPEEINKDDEKIELEELEKIIVDLVEDDLIISEFIPNPEGSDDNEWIELYNASDKNIDLYAWQIDDQEGGSKAYQFSTSTIILTKSFLLLNREETKITLNNSSDSVRLIKPDGELWQEVLYEKIPEGKSYAWDFENNEWVINKVSPGAMNIFAKDLEQRTEEISEEIEIIYGVAEINELAKNQEVIVQGVAINNVDSDERSLYLADYNFSEINFEEIVEIYSYYKNFPDIKAGELVTIQGKISRLDDLPRVKIKIKEDVWKNDLNVDLQSLEIIEVGDIEKDLLGAYINIKGIVVRKSGKNIYLASDIEEDYLIRVYSKFSTKELEIKKGDELMVVGILSETDTSFKLVPFDIGAIAVSKQVLGEKITAEKELGEISTSTSQIMTEDRKNNIKNILIFIIIGLVLISLIYFIKKKRGV